MASLLSMFFAPLISGLTDAPSLFVSSPFMRLDFRNKRFSQVSLKPTKASPAVSPVIRAHSSPDYEPDAKFYKVEAIIRWWTMPRISKALLKMGVSGVSVSEVKGFGAEGRMRERHAGSDGMFVRNVKIETVVRKYQVEAVIDMIIANGRTGQIGDGKIFVVPVYDVIKVRTGERGEKALGIVGGRSDMFSSSNV